MTRTRDPADRRRNVLRLTAAGRTAHERAMGAAQAAEDGFLEALGPVERATLRALLTDVMRRRLPWLADERRRVSLIAIRDPAHRPHLTFFASPSRR